MRTGTVLIVDDDANTLQSLEFILTAAGFSVLTARDGRVALDIIMEAARTRHPVELLIADIQMPVLSGLGLIEEIRRSNLEIPTLVITAYRDRNLQQELDRRNCTDILDKPLDEEILIARINGLFDRRMQEDKT